MKKSKKTFLTTLSVFLAFGLTLLLPPVAAHGCQLNATGTDCAPVSNGTSGRQAQGSFSSRFWSNHTTRQHRPVGTIRENGHTTTVRRDTWANSNVQNWTQFTAHGSSATFSSTFETK